MSSRVDVCSTELTATLAKTIGALQSAMSSSRASDAKREALSQVISELTNNIRRLSSAATKQTMAEEDIARLADRVIAEAILDFNNYAALDNKLHLILKKNQTNNANGVRDVMFEQLQQVANISTDARRVFGDQVDAIIADLATGGKDVTPEQLVGAKKLFDDVLEHGDDALVEYINRKYPGTDTDDIILKGLKSGHITDSFTNLRELDLVFKGLKKLETATQQVLEKKVPGYKALKGHAFVAAIDSEQIFKKSKEEFIDSAFGPNGFIFDLSGDKVLSAKINSITQAGGDATSLQRNFMAGIYEQMKKNTDVSNKTKLGGIFEDRIYNFVDDAGEIHFFKNLATSKDGLIRGRIKHLQRQLTEMRTREQLGTDPDRWLEHAQRVINHNLAGKLADGEAVKVKKLFRQLKTSIDSVTGRQSQMGEAMSDIWQITHNTVQAASTPLAGLRNITIDGTMHSAIVDRSFNPQNGMLLGSMKHASQMIRHMVGAGYGGDSTRKLVELMEANMISVKMGRAEAIRRLYSPGVTEFDRTGKTWLSKIRSYAEKSADVVSRYGLGDATYRATRVKGTIHAGSLIMKLTRNPDVAEPLLKRYGLDTAMWKDLQKYMTKIKTSDGSDLMYDLRHGLADLPDEIAMKYAAGVENADQVRARLGRDVTHMHQDLVDEFAARPTFKTGVSILSDSNNEYTSFIHSLIFKFMGIALSQQQSLVRSIRRINDVHNQTTGWMGTGIDSPADFLSGIVKRDKIMVNMSLAAGLAGSGYMTEALTNIVNGKTPGDLDKDAIFRSITSTGSAGLLMSMAASAYYRGDFIGTPAGRQIRAALGVGSGAIEGVTEGEWDRFQSQLFNLGKTTLLPASSLLIRNNSYQENVVKEWLGLDTSGLDRELSKHNKELLF